MNGLPRTSLARWVRCLPRLHGSAGGPLGETYVSRSESAFWEGRAGHVTAWPGNHDTRSLLPGAINTFETMSLAPGGHVLPFEAAVGRRLRIEAALFVTVGG